MIKSTYTLPPPISRVSRQINNVASVCWVSQNAQVNFDGEIQINASADNIMDAVTRLYKWFATMGLFDYSALLCQHLTDCDIDLRLWSFRERRSRELTKSSRLQVSTVVRGSSSSSCRHFSIFFCVQFCTPSIPRSLCVTSDARNSSSESKPRPPYS